MSRIRRWAGAAIVIGLIFGPIIACVGAIKGAAVGLAYSGDLCSAGCSERDAAAEQAARLILTGLIGGGVLVLGGIVTRRVDRRRESELEASSELPLARVVDKPRRPR